MAKSNQAKEIADLPAADDDPISELSDIMKFDPEEATLEQADEALQLDLENELMGDLAALDDAPQPEAENTNTRSTGLTGIPGMDDPIDAPEVADKDEAVELASDETDGLADDELDGAFEEVFDQTLDDAVGEAEPAVPQELESQLNDLLAGLGGSEQATEDANNDEEPAAEADENVEAADDLAEVEVAPEPVDLEPAVEAEAEDLVDLEPDDSAKSVVDGIEAAEEPESDDLVAEIEAEQHEDISEAAAVADPLASLAAITESIEAAATESADVTESETAPAPAPEEDTDPAPILETADIVDEAVPLEDDLDIPDVAFENEVPKVPDFDELDAEFSHAFNKLSSFDDVNDDTPTDVAEVTGDDSEPHLGEKLDDIFSEMADKAGEVAPALAAQSGAFDPTTDPDLNWKSDFPAARDDSYSDPVISGTSPDPALAQTGESGGAGRGILIAMIVAAIAVAGGIGAFALSFGGGDDTTTPALVKADDGPVKVKPKDPGGKTVPNEDKKVYERVAGNNEAETPTQEKLISTEEEPVDVAVNVSEPRVIVPDPVEPAEKVAEPKNDDRILPEAEQTGNETASGVVAIKPRRVKTLIVKPDGTLVPREEPAPEATEVTNELRAGTDDVTVAEDSTTETETAASTEVVAAAADQQGGDAAREVTFQAPASEDAVVVDGGSAPADEGVVVEGIPLPTPAPRAEIEAELAAVAAAEESRRNSQSETAAAAAETVPAAVETKPEATAQPEPEVAAVPVANTEWWVQISSQPSREGAQASYAELADRYGSIIGGRGVNIVRAVIEGKGTYYRVRIAGGSRREAAQLCSRLKNAGAGCFIAR